MSAHEPEGLIGKAPGPGETNPGTSDLPAEEHIDEARVEEDLQDPEEKENATDGYAPADDED